MQNLNQLLSPIITGGSKGPARSVSGTLPPLPQPANNFTWADGHWAIYSTRDANIHVGLLNLLSPDAFQKHVGGWSAVLDLAGELLARPHPLSWTKWREKKGGDEARGDREGRVMGGKEVEGNRGEERGWKRRGGWGKGRAPLTSSLRSASARLFVDGVIGKSDMCYVLPQRKFTTYSVHLSISVPHARFACFLSKYLIFWFFDHSVLNAARAI